MVHTRVAGGSVCVTENWMREDLSDLVLNESNTWKIKFSQNFFQNFVKLFSLGESENSLHLYFSPQLLSPRSQIRMA